jgi:hypothetical protein
MPGRTTRGTCSAIPILYDLFVSHQVTRGLVCRARHGMAQLHSCHSCLLSGWVSGGQLKVCCAVFCDTIIAALQRSLSGIGRVSILSSRHALLRHCLDHGAVAAGLIPHWSCEGRVAVQCRVRSGCVMGRGRGYAGLVGHLAELLLPQLLLLSRLILCLYAACRARCLRFRAVPARQPAVTCTSC